MFVVSSDFINKTPFYVDIPHIHVFAFVPSISTSSSYLSTQKASATYITTTYTLQKRHLLVVTESFLGAVCRPCESLATAVGALAVVSINDVLSVV